MLPTRRVKKPHLHSPPFPLTHPTNLLPELRGGPSGILGEVGSHAGVCIPGVVAGLPGHLRGERRVEVEDGVTDDDVVIDATQNGYATHGIADAYCTVIRGDNQTKFLKELMIT